jgi:hypothetical protein
MFTQVLNTMQQRGTLSRTHVLSERACQQHMEEQENILEWHSVDLLLPREDFLQVTVIHKHVFGKPSMMAACTHVTHIVCKSYTQRTVPCGKNCVSGYILFASCFHW